MKILFLNNNPEEKGTYWRCYWLAKYLVKFGHQVSLFCLQKNKTLKITIKTSDGVKIISLPRVADFGVKELPGHFLRIMIIILYGLFKQIDVIHAFNVASLTCGLPIIPFWLLRKIGLKKYKIVVDWDDWWGKGGLTTLNNQGKIAETVADFLETKIPPLADRVTTVSEELRSRAVRAGVKPKDIYKIINGANVESIKPIKKQEARKELTLSLKGKFVCFAGTMLINFTMVIKAFKKVIKKFPDARLLLLSPLTDKEKKSIEKEDLDNRVIVVGLQPYKEYLLYLAASDVLLLPRSNHILDRCEFPGRLGDFMASARPIVTNRSGDAWEIIEESKCGLVAEVGDSDDFALKIVQILRNPRLAKELARNGRKAAESKYSWESLAKVMLKEVYA